MEIGNSRCTLLKTSPVAGEVFCAAQFATLPLLQGAVFGAAEVGKRSPKNGKHFLRYLKRPQEFHIITR